ncbi:hypothetical protein DB42_AN00080 [Neochlamydia sp. EPS4]|uniref:hypothetical protein n=1 Tax=Neochlamydia sp. EPS4 TaxID=1478175 RepID=UPI000583E778|nr:hypothetical protein [Neochlamydia sp. EPS4]KIC75153.1 hypothetical protein DB42_AN00080 [Neochlamydia sp. EPS4]
MKHRRLIYLLSLLSFFIPYTVEAYDRIGKNLKIYSYTQPRRPRRHGRQPTSRANSPYPSKFTPQRSYRYPPQGVHPSSKYP